jgi:hypothetical protein
MGTLSPRKVTYVPTAEITYHQSFCWVQGACFRNSPQDGMLYGGYDLQTLNQADLKHTHFGGRLLWEDSP